VQSAITGLGFPSDTSQLDTYVGPLERPGTGPFELP